MPVDTHPSRHAPTAEHASAVAHQCFLLLRLGFTVLPIVFGLDKFTNLLVDWTAYLAPWIVDLAPVGPSTIMHVVGVVEIVAGLVVAFNPATAAGSSAPGCSPSSSRWRPPPAGSTSPCVTSDCCWPP